MSSISLIFGAYNHQPDGTDSERLETHYQQSYKPFLSLLYNFPRLHTVLHYCGSLFEWMEDRHPEFIMLLKEMIRRKQVELLGGGYHAPILPLIPDGDKLGQIEKMSTFIRTTFGTRPRGSWLAERVWEPSLARILSNSGIENLHASYQILKKLNSLIDIKSEDLVVVSPDTGAVDRNKYYSSNLHKPLAVVYKERDYSRISNHANDTNISTTRLLGSVVGKTVFMADDMLGTGGTLLQAMRYLKEMGAKKIICAVSLPLFSGSAVEHFQKAYEEGLFYRIIGTNAVHHTKELLACEWFVSANISGLFAQIIFRLHHGKSLSPLLDNSSIIQRLLKQKDE